MKFIPFFFDGNLWAGTVDEPLKWFSLLSVYPLGEVLYAKMAPQSELHELPPEYHLGAPGVQQGTLPSFGFRREHHPGTVCLEDWAQTRGMNLRALAATKPAA